MHLVSISKCLVLVVLIYLLFINILTLKHLLFSDNLRRANGKLTLKVNINYHMK